MFPIETDRLVLRSLQDTDAPFLVELMNSKGWLDFIGDRHIRDVEAALKYLKEGPYKSYAANGYGLGAVCLKNTGEFTGKAGLLKRSYLDYPDLGFAMPPKHYGKGYTFEISKAVLDNCCLKLQLECVDAIVQPDNKISIHLLEKLGFREINPGFSNDSGEILNHYRISIR